MPEQLGGYRVLEALGRGGMGMVYRVQADDGQDFAMKVVHTAGIDDPVAIERFRGEIATLQRLRHPHICQLRDSGEDDGRIYLVMDLVTGPSLGAWAAERREDWLAITRTLATVARAVSHAHGLGILHRDLKPDNIIITDDGPVVMDFGLAVDLESDHRLTADGAAVGTPLYMAPEQTLGLEGRLGRWTDAWAIGATAYHTLCGRPPFEGSSTHDIYIGINERPHTPLHRNAPWIPDGLSRIIDRCLLKRSDERYHSCLDLAADLEAVAHGRRVVVPLPGPLRLGLRRIRQRPLPAVLLALVLVLAGALAWGSYRWLNARHTEWVTLAEVAVDHGSSSDFELIAYGGREPLPPLADGLRSRYPEDLENRPRWIHWQSPSLNPELKVEIAVSLPKKDAVEISIDADPDTLSTEAWWHHPSGWGVKVVFEERPYVLISFMESSEYVTDSDALPFDRPATNDITITIEKELDTIIVNVNGSEVGRLTEPRSLIAPQGRSVLMRAWQASTRFRDIRIARLSAALLASPLTPGDQLAANGQVAAAVEAYLAVADTQPGSDLEARALVRAILLQGRIDGAEGRRRSLAARFEQAFPASRFQRRLDADLIRLQWQAGRQPQALRLLRSHQDRYPDTHLPYELLTDAQRPGATIAHELLVLCARQPGLARVHLDHLGLESLEPLRGLALAELTSVGNPIRDISALTDMPLVNLSLDGSRITDWRPLATLDELSRLDIDQPGSLDVDLLRTCRSLYNLNLKSLSLEHGAGLQRLPLTTLSLNACPGSAAIRLPPIVRSLSVSRAQPPPLTDIATLPELDYLALRATGMLDLSPLVACQTLTNLTLSDLQVRDLQPISDLALTTLTLSRVAAPPPTHLPATLKTLSLTGLEWATLPKIGPNLKSAHYEALPLREPPPLDPALVYLHFEDCPTPRQWPDLPLLRHLDLERTRDVVLPPAATTPRLNSLSLYRSTCSDPSPLYDYPLTSGNLIQTELPSEERPILAAHLRQRGEYGLALQVDAALAMAGNRPSHLRATAWRIGASDFSLVPMPGATYDSAARKAEELGGRLALIPDLATDRALAQLLPTGSAKNWIIGLRALPAGSPWHRAEPTAYRSRWLSAEDATAPGWWMLSRRRTWTHSSHGEPAAGFIVEWPDQPLPPIDD